MREDVYYMSKEMVYLLPQRVGATIYLSGGDTHGFVL